MDMHQVRVYKIGGEKIKVNVGKSHLHKNMTERDGFKCNCPNCCTDREKAISRLGLNWIQVDHIDDNRDNNCLDNLQLLCTTCNNPMVKAKLFA